MPKSWCIDNTTFKMLPCCQTYDTLTPQLLKCFPVVKHMMHWYHNFLNTSLSKIHDALTPQLLNCFLVVNTRCIDNTAFKMHKFSISLISYLNSWSTLITCKTLWLGPVDLWLQLIRQLIPAKQWLLLYNLLITHSNNRQNTVLISVWAKNNHWISFVWLSRLSIWEHSR